MDHLLDSSEPNLWLSSHPQTCRGSDGAKGWWNYLACARAKAHGYDIRTAKMPVFSLLQPQQLLKYSINNVHFNLSNFNRTNPILSSSILEQLIYNVSSVLTNSSLNYVAMVCYNTTCGCEFKPCGAARAVNGHIEATCGCKFYPCGEASETNSDAAFKSHDTCAVLDQAGTAELGLQQVEQQDNPPQLLDNDYPLDIYDEYWRHGNDRWTPFGEETNLM